MRVKCIYNKLVDLSLETREKIGINFRSHYPIEINEEFNVYGQLADKKGLVDYLVIGHEYPRSYWLPSELFEIIDTTLPANWYFTKVENSQILAIWGFYELTHDFDFFDKLTDRDDGATKKFTKRVKEMDLQLKNDREIEYYLSEEIDNNCSNDKKD